MSKLGAVPPRTREHVAVLMGGWSAEREVSLNSGAAVAAALQGEGYRVTKIDADRGLAARLAEVKPDVCFNALHGKFGEDGCVQGILECMAIPYTHSGVLASSLAMHKELAKTVMKASGVPVAEAKLVTRREAASRHVMAPPYVVKPVDEGSSVGVVIVRPGSNNMAEMILQGATPLEMLQTALGTSEVEVLDERALQFACNCSRERFLDKLAALPRADLDEMIADGTGEVLTCHICTSSYTVTIDDLRALVHDESVH